MATTAREKTPGRCRQGQPLLLAALDELLTEQLRHRDTLIRFAQQLERLAADPSLHIHLDPIEHYRELARNRLFADPPAD